MKVLVISLLRLGDFLQALPVIHGLQAKRIDLLTFTSVRAFEGMVPGVKQWWTLNRDDLQAGLGQAEIPMLTSFSILKEQLEAINAEKYDCIINLSQTEFSAWIAGYLEAPNRNGLSMNPRGEASFHSPWFRYLNDRTAPNTADVFHYSDIFYYGSGLQGDRRDWTLRETAAGRKEAAAFNAEETIVVQALTSDTKKTWPLSSWSESLRQIRFLRPNAELVLLGSAAEAGTISELATSTGTKPAILSLAGALSLLHKAQLLITGDTSIKHLANATDIPVLELSLGPSDYRRTGIYRAGNLILQAKVGCAPCMHSAPCSQTTHACAQGLKASVVAESAAHLLAGDWSALTNLAAGNPELHFLRTYNAENGFWLARDLRSVEAASVVRTALERSTWKFLLNREHLKALPTFGSESLHLKRTLENLFSAEERPLVAKELDFLANESERNKQAAETELMRLRAGPRRATNQIVDIGEIRRAWTRAETAAQYSQIENKMVQILKTQLTETT